MLAGVDRRYRRALGVIAAILAFVDQFSRPGPAGKDAGPQLRVEPFHLVTALENARRLSQRLACER